MGGPNVSVERFELPMLLTTCGYTLSDLRIKQLNDFLDERKAEKIDEKTLILVLTHLKDLELNQEQDNEADEYLDAFVALGG